MLVADTSVIDGAQILGKPASGADAERIIAQLAGRTHEVWTRFMIGAAVAARTLHEELGQDEEGDLPRAHVGASPRVCRERRGRDKAGAYAVRAAGAGLVSHIEGSYSNVVGLPACEVMVALERPDFDQARETSRAPQPSLRRVSSRV